MTTEETTPLIFDSLFLVLTPMYETVSMEEIDERGTPTTLDAEFDRALMTDLVRIYLPISAIATRMNEGSKLSIPNPNDILTMYNNIELHLEAWKNEVYDKPYSGSCPSEDLIILDKLADHLYYPAKEIERQRKMSIESPRPARRFGSSRPVSLFMNRQNNTQREKASPRAGYGNYFRSKVTKFR